MSDTVPLLPGQMYHIFNRGNNGEDLFRADAHYHRFMALYAHHIRPIADTYAFCFMGNHFHLLVQIRGEEALARVFPRFRDWSDSMRAKRLSRCFANFFGAYAKSVNRNRPRTGALFERPFHRKPIRNERHAMAVLDYIHRNPVHHGFVQHPAEWPWSSLSAQSDQGLVTKWLIQNTPLEAIAVDDFA